MTERSKGFEFPIKRKASVKYLFVFIVLYGLAANLAHPVTPAFIQSLKLHDYMFGVAFACMSFSSFLFSPFWGKLTKNVGCVRILAVGYMGYSVCQALFCFSTTEVGIGVARALAGIFIGAISVSHIIYVVQNSSDENRGQNLAVSATLQAVTSPFGYMAGGLLGDIHIKFPFYVQIAALFLLGILYLVFVEDGKDIKREKTALRTVVKESNPLLVFFNSRKIITVSVLFFLFLAVSAAFGTTCYEQCFNYYLREQLNFPPSYNGLVKAVIGLIALFANSTICIWLMKKTDTRKTIVPVFAVCFASLVMVFVSPNGLVFAVFNIVFNAVNAVYQPLLQAIITYFKNTDNDILVGLYNSMKALGQVGGSLLAGLVYAAGPKLSFLIAGLAFLASMIFAIACSRTFQRQSVSEQSSVQ